MVGDAFVVHEVTKKYGNRTILDRISCTVRRGEILGLIGASGAGKTTLLHMLVGFVPSTSGSITFWTPQGAQVDVHAEPAAMARHYGFASQHPSFYERLTVLENLRYFGEMYGMGREAIDQNAETLLRLLGLKSSSHMLAQHLSGGMKRRLDIACALLHRPSTLILDEPTADLDPVLRNQIWDVVKHARSRGTTVILSSHHLNELDTLCDRIAILKDGRLIDIDTPKHLKAKYNRMQEILIETFPGNYETIAKRLASDGVEATRHGTTLVIRTENPEEVIGRLLPALKREGESLLDLKLVKPNLDNVFVTIYKGAP